MAIGKMELTKTARSSPPPISVAFWANEAGVNVAAAEGLRSKLTRVFNRPYIIEYSGEANIAQNSLKKIIEALKAGRHVILSFGDYESDLDYLLVSNLLTRSHPRSLGGTD